MVTMRDIAKQAEVSQTTVSLVLNGRASILISEATKQRVKKTAREMGYRPNMIARALVTGRTDTIALWTKELHSSYYQELVDEFDSLVSASGYKMTISRHAAYDGNSPDLDGLPIMPVDGIIAIDIPGIVEMCVGLIGSRSVPIVSVGHDYSDVVDSVTVNTDAPIRDAFTHLWKCGRRKIAFLIDEISHVAGGGIRLATYKAFLKEQNISSPIVICAKEQSYSAAQSAVAAFLSGSETIDALFCFNDDMAIGANRAIYDANLRIPEDIAVVGYDGIVETDYVIPRLSTIVQPRKEICIATWNLLQKRLKDPDTPIEHVCLSGVFRPSESSQKNR